MRNATLVLFLAALITALPATAQSPVDRIEGEIRSTHAQMRQAAENLDGVALFAYVSNTSTPPIIEDGELAPSRAAALERTMAGFRGLAKLSYTYTRDNVTVLSADSALWVAEGTATATLADGRAISAPFAETIVFLREHGQWRVLHAHRSAPNRR